ncbi:RCC1 domain-containing protein [Massilia soli]|uniref:Chromosome condensation regulator RCC1 n=1 Tax=Massilia soli TaxID=2792854 RepID=A0ABS7SUD4_9BURK|nr:hypothetical protein [Massilia soli]MBZ2209572.1 hypothetical protein [Massilia soli]
MRFQLDGCAAVTEAAGGSKTRRVFSCTPSGSAGSRTLQVFQSATATTSLSSKAVEHLTPVLDIGELNSRVNVVKADGTLWVWENDWTASTAANTVITRTQLGTNYTKLEVSEESVLGIRTDGTLWAWGSNNAGTFADGPRAGSPTPIEIGKDFIEVAAKGSHTSAGGRVVGLKRDGSLWAWGSRSSPVPNSWERQFTPHQFGSGFSALAGGSSGLSMALQANGSIWSWHENISDAPFVVKKIGDDYQALATAYGATYGLKKNGDLWAWGRNAPNRGEVGTEDVPVLAGQGYASLAAGAYYTMALKTDGTLWAHGSNSEGQFGDGTTGGAPTLTQVATGVRKVWAGDSCTIIEKRNGTLWGTSYCRLGVTSGIPAHGFRQLPQF